MFKNFNNFKEHKVYLITLFFKQIVHGDGSLNFSEFMFALSITSRGTFERRLRWAYSMYDLDHDGFISKHEMLTMVKVGLVCMFKINAMKKNIDFINLTLLTLVVKLF